MRAAGAVHAADVEDRVGGPERGRHAQGLGRGGGGLQDREAVLHVEHPRRLPRGGGHRHVVAVPALVGPRRHARPAPEGDAGVGLHPHGEVGQGRRRADPRVLADDRVLVAPGEERLAEGLVRVRLREEVVDVVAGEVVVAVGEHGAPPVLTVHLAPDRVGERPRRGLARSAQVLGGAEPDEAVRVGERVERVPGRVEVETDGAIAEAGILRVCGRRARGSICTDSPEKPAPLSAISTVAVAPSSSGGSASAPHPHMAPRPTIRVSPPSEIRLLVFMIISLRGRYAPGSATVSYQGCGPKQERPPPPADRRELAEGRGSGARRAPEPVPAGKQSASAGRRREVGEAGAAAGLRDAPRRASRRVAGADQGRLPLQAMVHAGVNAQ